MKILSIEMTNYGPFYGHHKFELHARGLVCVLGDNQDEPRMNSNGAGKSSLVEALDWALFGTVPRGDSTDSVINDEAAAEGQGVYVVVHAEDHDGVVRVERRRKFENDSGLRLFYDGEEVTSLDTKETQSFVECQLGVDRQVFHATVLFGQTDLFRFADATDGERMDILTRILRLELVDVWLDQAKLLRSGVHAAIADADKNVAALKGKRDALASIDSRAQAEQYERERAANVASMNATLAELHVQYQDAVKRSGVHDARPASPPMPTRTPDHEQALKDLAQSKASVYEVETLWRQLQSKAENSARLTQLGDVCQTCEQPVGPGMRQAYVQCAEHDSAERDRTYQLLEQWRGYAESIERVIRGYEDAYQGRVQESYRQAAQLNAELKIRQQAAASSHTIKAQMAQVQGRIREQAERANPFVAQESQRDAQMAEASQRIADFESLRAKRLQADESLAFWIDSFGPRGIKSYVLDARLQEMTDAANHWCKLLTGGTYWVRLETQTALKTGALRNRFNIRVFNGHGEHVSERHYKSWSGGQKQRISLAIDFGLSRLIARRAKKPYELLILDEVFKHLDRAGRDAVMEMLIQLKYEKSTILVVDHDAEFLAMFEQQVTVRMQAGRASIHEGIEDHVVEPEQPAAKPAASRKNVPRRAPVESRPKHPKASPKRRARDRVDAG